MSMIQRRQYKAWHTSKLGWKEAVGGRFKVHSHVRGGQLGRARDLNLWLADTVRVRTGRAERGRATKLAGN